MNLPRNVCHSHPKPYVIQGKREEEYWGLENEVPDDNIPSESREIHKRVTVTKFLIIKRTLMLEMMMMTVKSHDEGRNEGTFPSSTSSVTALSLYFFIQGNDLRDQEGKKENITFENKRFCTSTMSLTRNPSREQLHLWRERELLGFSSLFNSLDAKPKYYYRYIETPLK